MNATAKITDLRKAFSAQGVKGASKLNRAAYDAAVEAAHEAAIAEDAERTPAPAPVAPATPKKGACTECGRKLKGEEFGGLCDADRSYGEWENTHSDEGHEIAKEDGCPVCYPELDPRTAVKPGRSRMGMVIVAKGSELHKSLTFKEAAEAVGWTVEIARETYELGDDAEGEGTRYYATAVKGNDSISLAWDGRAYDYPASSAQLNGKARKVRNLKEALRLL